MRIIRRSTALVTATILALAMLAGISTGTEKVSAAGGLTGVRICIDPGHGGSGGDSGGSGPAGLYEKDINLKVGLYLRDILASDGAEVKMTRSTDVAVGFTERANIANDFHANLFVSIHHNAVGDPSINGTETWVGNNASSDSWDLAERVQTQLLQEFGLPDRGVQTNHVPAITVLEKTVMPAILTEASFYSNPAEEQRLGGATYQRREAEAIARGIKGTSRIAIVSPNESQLLSGVQNVQLNLMDPNALSVHFLVDGQDDGTETVSPFTHVVDTTKYPDGKRMLEVEVTYANDKIYSATRDLQVSNAARNWYLAEGTTIKGFDEYLTIMNPNEADTPFQLRYCFADGSYSDRAYTAPHHTRMTIRVNTDVGPDKDVSCVIQADAPLVAERPMYFNYTSQVAGDIWQGGHDVLGVNEPALSWYFAEGCTAKNFEEYICLVNPGDRDAAIEVVYMPAVGKPITREHTVGAHARKTIFVNNDAGPDLELSVKIISTNNVPIVAERPLYFNFGGSWPGGSDVVGATDASLQWYFAEGYTGTGFSEWLCLQNPDTVPADVTVTYYFKDGSSKARILQIAPLSRYSVSVNQDVGADREVSVSVTSNIPVVAERPLYYNYHNWAAGGDAVMGASSPRSDWFFAEGYTGPGFEEWLCLMNPSTVDSRVVATYIKNDGDSITLAYQVPAHSRFTILVNEACASSEVSVVLHASRPVVAERPLYFIYGKDAGGSAGVGFSPGLPR